MHVLPASVTAGQTDFQCADVGVNTITLTATDVNGNAATCNATVTVIDNIPPVPVCQDITVQLGDNGSATITGLDTDNGSSDACGIASRTVDNDTFDCSDIGAVHPIVLTVTDHNGNSSTCSANVTVQDNTAPNARCKTQTITLPLDEAGQANLAVHQIDNNSTDACGIASREIGISALIAMTPVPHTVTLTVTDLHGNVATCTSKVFITDLTAPVLVCPDQYTIQLDEYGKATVDLQEYASGSSDNCGITVWEAQLSEFDCNFVGSMFMVLTVYDEAGNSDFCFKPITIVDNIAPVGAVPGCDGTAGRQRFGYAHRRRSGQRLERRLRHTVGSAQPAVVRLWGCGG
ncbi:MAG: hypothetical protein H6566_15865 [Lewinellaceae bacterium]|nr:hypothetical protein [Lewinellaceae bacterium]